MQQSIPGTVSVHSKSSRLGALVRSASVTLIPQRADADVAGCISAHESGQVEAKAGRLKRAAELFGACGATEDCPTAVRAECVELYRDVEKSVPTVIFAAVDERGSDITDVQVFAEDQLLTGGLDGRSLPLDPGKYALRFVFPKGKSVNVEVLVREGEKNRVISVKAPEHTPVHSGMSASSAAQEPETSGGGHPTGGSLPVSFWVSSGVSAAAILSWGTFALLGRGQQSKLNECSPRCDSSVQGNFDAMRRDYLIADVSLGVAAISAGAATWFLLSRDNSHSAVSTKIGTRHTARVSLRPLLLPSSAGLVVSGEAL
ncbi:MAG: hypothetical protein ACM3ZE_12740 [Myxococcales bacterium]